MEEIITKDNLDTYTQGLKGVLSSMGEAINNAGSSDAGEEITITVTNISGNAHVDVKSGDTMIQSITSNGTSTVTVPFGIEYTIMGYDSTGLYVGGGVRDVANKMSSSISVDCTAIDGVDLGLPSGKIWATKNIGASNSYDNGRYYSYGGRAQSNGYSYWSASTVASGAVYGYPYTSGDPEHDAARASWGGDWRVPTRAEFQELASYCTSDVSTHYSNCFDVTGPNGKYIIVPASGYKKDGVRLNNTYAYFITSTFVGSNVSGSSTTTDVYCYYGYIYGLSRTSTILCAQYSAPVRAIRDGSV